MYKRSTYMYMYVYLVNHELYKQKKKLEIWPPNVMNILNPFLIGFIV